MTRTSKVLLSAVLVMSGFGDSAAEEFPWIEEEIKDPAQLAPAERHERLLGCIKLLEDYPDSEAGRHLVGPLLMFHESLTGDLASRAAKVLERVAKQTHGTDFEAWRRWFETVKDTDEWRPTRIYKSRPNPNYLPSTASVLLVYSREKAVQREGGWTLHGDVGVKCARYGLYLESHHGLEVDWDSGKGSIRFTSAEDFALSYPSAGPKILAITKCITLTLGGLARVEILDVEWLRAVAQSVDESRLAGADPEDVLRYACEAAEAGNMAPLIRLFGEDDFEDCSSEEGRAKLVESAGLRQEQVARMTQEECATEWLRADYVNLFHYRGIRIRHKESEAEVRYTRERFNGSSSGWLRLKDGAWRIR